MSEDGISSERLIDQQIQFARHDFENLQALIRFSDTKAGATLTLLVFLGASGLQIIKEAVLATHLSPRPVALLSVLLVFSCGGLLCAFLACLWAVQAVLRPRGARYYRTPTPGTDLLWQDHITAHGTNDAYYQAVKIAESGLLLKNLTDQVFELAHISQEKMAGIHAAWKACWFGFWCWVVAITSGLILLRLK